MSGADLASGDRLQRALAAVVEGEDLEPAVMESAMEAILGGEAPAVLIGALVVALRMKGETSDEIAAAAAVMRRRCTPLGIELPRPLLDTCGTGGDGSNTFNISTASAIVAAACGVMVAKHGNRAVSSRAGSADVLEALGVRIDLPIAKVAEGLREIGIGFLFAPAHHAAMRHAAPVRKELGIRTIFNLLGPLSNPAGATHQLMGVYSADRIESMAKALGALGTEGAWVVHGDGGLDEVSPSGSTEVAVLRQGVVTRETVYPRDFGLEPVALGDLRGGDATRNAAILRSVLAGEEGAPRTAVLINAGAALCAAGVAASPREGAERAREAIDSGEAERKLTAWIELGRS